MFNAMELSISIVLWSQLPFRKNRHGFNSRIQFYIFRNASSVMWRNGQTGRLVNCCMKNVDGKILEGARTHLKSGIGRTECCKIGG